MERKTVTSNLIRSIGYDPATKVLEIEFLRNQKQDVRPVYQYPDFPQEKFDALMGVGKPEGEKHSIGSHFLKFVKPNAKFVKVEEHIETQKEADAQTTGSEASEK